MFSSLATYISQDHRPCFFPSMGRLIWGLAMQALVACHQQWCMLDRYTCWQICFLIVKVLLNTQPTTQGLVQCHRPWVLLTILNQHTRVFSSWCVCGYHD
jgi:hypothetical protein